MSLHRRLGLSQAEIDHARTCHRLPMEFCIEQARRAVALPTNYRVGAAILSEEQLVLTYGYTNERPGNTHAEQVCLQKVGEMALPAVPEEEAGGKLPDNCTLYTTMEPCAKRLSGQMSCVDRIIRAGKIKRVVFGLKEPDIFVSGDYLSEGRKRLQEAGIEVIHYPGFEDEILEVATAGHVKEGKQDDKAAEGKQAATEA